MSLLARVEYLKLGIALNVKTFCMVNIGITQSRLDILLNISSYNNNAVYFIGKICLITRLIVRTYLDSKYVLSIVSGKKCCTVMIAISYRRI